VSKRTYQFLYGQQGIVTQKQIQKTTFSKTPVDVLSFNMLYMVINIYIYGIVGVREGEEEKRTYPRGEV
jgi:hypothetical protein